MSTTHISAKHHRFSMEQFLLADDERHAEEENKSCDESCFAELCDFFKCSGSHMPDTFKRKTSPCEGRRERG